MASEEAYTKKINRYFLNKIWDFPSMRLCNKSNRNKQKGQKFFLKHCFFTEAFHYPAYVIRYKKNDKYRQKRKICTKNYARKRCPLKKLYIENH